MSIEAMKQALEALEWATGCMSFDDYDDMPEATESLENAHKAITSLRQAITTEESSAVQEPVAWKPDRSGKYLTIVYKDVVPGDEVGALHEHPKCVAMSWSNALHDVDYLKNHPQPKAERNFCERCGKRLFDGIHTCTPPAAQAEQEPVAWGVHDQIALNKTLETNQQTKREWVGLTDEDEIDWDEVGLRSLVKAVEAKLKEKNT